MRPSQARFFPSLLLFRSSAPIQFFARARGLLSLASTVFHARTELELLKTESWAHKSLWRATQITRPFSRSFHSLAAEARFSSAGRRQSVFACEPGKKARKKLWAIKKNLPALGAPRIRLIGLGSSSRYRLFGLGRGAISELFNGEFFPALESEKRKCRALIKGMLLPATLHTPGSVHTVEIALVARKPETEEVPQEPARIHTFVFDSLNEVLCKSAGRGSRREKKVRRLKPAVRDLIWRQQPRESSRVYGLVLKKLVKKNKREGVHPGRPSRRFAKASSLDLAAANERQHARLLPRLC